MSNSSEKLWSDNPNAPRIPHWVYFAEKATFAGVFLGAVLYGIVIILFFQCMRALLDYANRKTKAAKWGLRIHTSFMFMSVTICGALYLDYQRISYIDNREFPSVDGVLPPGPFGYTVLTQSSAINVATYSLFLVNQWLADGFLLYRCYIIYFTDFWVIIFPFLMYLASIAMGITLVYNQASDPDTVYMTVFATKSMLSYLIISISLNVLLTLMIVIQVLLHRKRIQTVMGASAETSGLYKSIISMLVESCALYVGSFLVYAVTRSLNDSNQLVAEVFKPILAETQVIAPFLTILRIANRTAVTSDSITSCSGSIRFASEEQSTSHDETIHDGDPVSSGMSGEIFGGLCAVVEKTIEAVPLEGSLRT